MKKLALVSVLFIILVGVIWIAIAQNKSIPKEIPKISISIGGQSIRYVSAPNTWNGEMPNRKDTFKMIRDEFPTIEIPYIKLDEMVKIDFGKNPPDKIDILDCLINKNGDQRYEDKVAVKGVKPNFNEGVYTFEIKKSMSAGLSSNSVSYEPGNTWRGYRIICSWGYNECEYAFIIRTDSGWGVILPENQMEVKIAAGIEKYHPTMSSVPGLPLIASFEEKEGKKYKLQWKISAGLLLLWDKKTGKIENLENPAFTDNEMVYWSSVRGNSGEFIANKDIDIKVVVLDEDENVMGMAEAEINIDKDGYATIKK